jgi:hypothetical protein
VCSPNGRYTDEAKQTGMAALSMIMGQMGLWSGTWHLTSPRVDSKTVIEIGPVQVFATASSRAGVPVQWQEGFSLLVMARWDGQLSREILLNWLNTMQVLVVSTPTVFMRKCKKNNQGWFKYLDMSMPVALAKTLIPRTFEKCLPHHFRGQNCHLKPPFSDMNLIPQPFENAGQEGGWMPQALVVGESGRSLVDKDSHVQRMLHATPPTLLLAMEALLDHGNAPHDFLR